jgi:hypothetical protein
MYSNLLSIDDSFFEDKPMEELELLYVGILIFIGCMALFGQHANGAINYYSLLIATMWWGGFMFSNQYCFNNVRNRYFLYLDTISPANILANKPCDNSRTDLAITRYMAIKSKRRLFTSTNIEPINTQIHEQ